MAWASKEARNAYQEIYRRAKGIQPRRRRIPPLCPVCDGPVPASNRRYCSRDCQFAGTQQLQIDAWLGGHFNPPHAGEGRIPDYIKRWWLNTFGEQCVGCGWAKRREADGRIPLTWDHVDGDCSNNRRENLRLLCPNCHALTSTYGSLNKVSRRKRWGLHNGRTSNSIAAAVAD